MFAAAHSAQISQSRRVKSAHELTRAAELVNRILYLYNLHYTHTHTCARPIIRICVSLFYYWREIEFSPLANAELTACSPEKIELKYARVQFLLRHNF